ncbi:MAG: hypothetical protein AABZ60_18685 [Planctomycetota bacterium]
MQTFFKCPCCGETIVLSVQGEEVIEYVEDIEEVEFEDLEG